MQEYHESNYQKFVRWFHGEGGISKKIKYPEYFQEIDVRGVAAGEDIGGNEVFLAIPKKLIIGMENVEKSQLGEILKKYSCFRDSQENQGEFNVLTLFVVWQKMKGESSFYYPYFQVIEKSQTIISWSDEDIQKIGDPSITIEFINSLRQEFYPVFEQFKLIVKQYPKLFQANLTWQFFMECYSLVMTRCFGWGLPETMLVPYADFLNHSSHGIYHYVFNKRLEEEEVEGEYIKKKKQLDLSLLGIDNKNLLPKSYLRNKRQQFVFKYKGILKQGDKDLQLKDVKQEQRVHNNETKQYMNMIQREMMQASYDVELLASSNSEDNDSQEEDNENGVQIKVKISEMVSEEIQPSFSQPAPEVNRQFEDDVTFNWWYKMEREGSYFIVAGNRQIKKGQQIFNNYGRRNNRFLLIYYGFTYQNNKYDSVCFRFWSQQIYQKRGKLIFVQYFTEKDLKDYICLGNQRYNFDSFSDQYRLKLDNICYELMAFLRIRIISKREPFKTMFYKKQITFHKIHSLELEMLMLEDYMSVLKAVSQIYEPQRQREELSNKQRNFFAKILNQSNKNIIENHINGVNMLIKVVNKMKEGSMSLLEVYKSSLTLQEEKFMFSNGDGNRLKTIELNNRKFVLDYFKMLERYFEGLKQK